MFLTNGEPHSERAPGKRCRRASEGAGVGGIELRGQEIEQFGFFPE
jgi:hypothetical protein